MGFFKKAFLILLRCWIKKRFSTQRVEKVFVVSAIAQTQFFPIRDRLLIDGQYCMPSSKII